MSDDERRELLKMALDGRRAAMSLDDAVAMVTRLVPGMSEEEARRRLIEIVEEMKGTPPADHDWLFNPLSPF